MGYDGIQEDTLAGSFPFPLELGILTVEDHRSHRNIKFSRSPAPLLCLAKGRALALSKLSTRSLCLLLKSVVSLLSNNVVALQNCKPHNLLYCSANSGNRENQLSSPAIISSYNIAALLTKLQTAQLTSTSTSMSDSPSEL